MYRTDAANASGLASSSAEDIVDIGIPPSTRARALKRAVDIFGSIFLIVLLLPMIVVVAIGVRLSSSGPIFYAQTRSGRGGRHFQFYKFRSMKVNSEDVLADFLNSDPEAKKRWDQYQKIDNDPRITAFGRFIRRTSLDELPQFWNVLRGDMSLVGPRPCMLQQKELYGRYWRAYCAVKPGITGLWQVSGRNRLTYEERVRLDVQYVRNLSAWGDIKLLAKTIKVVLSAHGAH
ncbi:sugar transferase [Ramlibacter pinisoli]|uniref:Sugar transferase n=1 Tax=Ramlibacter pinisoli TaxID=2682844 RepID=A0A6N8ISS2_9BURK|nr:sugar transferase [Ramlibacter pinisoli]MBA2964817.1 sugar transferase [Ramlibacter sp. CGMCC 1.13660]MVQ29782.1 sugar transferase [Ramlibacter pinisoli]